MFFVCVCVFPVTQNKQCVGGWDVASIELYLSLLDPISLSGYIAKILERFFIQDLYLLYFLKKIAQNSYYLLSVYYVPDTWASYKLFPLDLK